MNRTCTGLALAALLLAPAAGAQVYSARDLGTLGGPSSAALGINASGHVVGGSLTAKGEYHAFVWTPERGMFDLGTLGGTWSQARGINDLGQVVGISTLPPDDISGETYHAFLWDHGKLQDLGNETSMTWGSSYAEAINGSGQIAGANWGRASRWSALDGWVDLGVIDASHAYAISDLGVVVGSFKRYYGSWDGPTQAFAWKDGVARQLAPAPGHKFAWAYGVNDAEQIVGCSSAGDLVTKPGVSGLLWSGDATLVLTPGENSCVHAVNDHGQAVGWWRNGAFVWSAATGPLGLPGPGGSASMDAYAIDDRGDIVGASQFGPAFSGQVHATLWTVGTPGSGGDQGIPALVAAVQGLVDAGVLDAGQGNSLSSKLEVAAARLSSGQPAAAANVLRAFEMEVEAFVRAGVLTAAIAEPLRVGAEGVVAR